VSTQVVLHNCTNSWCSSLATPAISFMKPIFRPEIFHFWVLHRSWRHLKRFLRWRQTFFFWSAKLRKLAPCKLSTKNFCKSWFLFTTENLNTHTLSTFINFLVFADRGAYTASGLPDFSRCMIPKPKIMFQMNTKCNIYLGT
jgi:hypothetical protein